MVGQAARWKALWMEGFKELNKLQGNNWRKLPDEVALCCSQNNTETVK